MDTHKEARVSPTPLNGEDIEEARDVANSRRQRGQYEFHMLRDAYDRVKPEAPQAGFSEFLRLYNSPEWRSDSLDEILAGLDALAKADRQFLGEERYRPGLAKFLSQGMWAMKPRLPEGQDEAMTPEQEALKRRADENARKMRERMAERRKILGG